MVYHINLNVLVDVGWLSQIPMFCQIAFLRGAPLRCEQSATVDDWVDVESIIFVGIRGPGKPEIHQRAEQFGNNQYKNSVYRRLAAAGQPVFIVFEAF